jgi:hypothetical protein
MLPVNAIHREALPVKEERRDARLDARRYQIIG